MTTAPVFIQALGDTRWCRLLTVGVVSHVTACRARIAADRPVLLTSTAPPAPLLCAACGADLAARGRRSASAPGPSVEVVGVTAELAVEAETAAPVAPAPSRTTTMDLRAPRPALDPVSAWDSWWEASRPSTPNYDDVVAGQGDEPEDNPFDPLNDLRIPEEQ